MPGNFGKLSQKDFDAEARRILGDIAYEKILRTSKTPRDEATKLMIKGRHSHRIIHHVSVGRLAGAGPD